MIPRWVNYTQGVPIAADFATAGGFGPSLCIDQTTGTVYYLNSSGVPTAISGGGGGSAWGSITGILSAQTDLQTALDGKQPLATVLTNTTAAFTTAQETKLAGIATGATANQTDTFLLSRANHTGTQSVSTITGLAAIATSGSAADLSSGTIPAARMPALTGDVTTTAGAVATTITAGAVSLSKMANLAANSLIGNNTGGSAVPLALTTAQVTAMLDVVASGTKGLAPASGGGTINFLRADGTWAVPPGSGGSPGGSTTQIQFNDAGAFGGDADLTWDKAGNTLTLGGTDTGVILNGITNEPSAPSSGTLRYYAKSIAGRIVPKVKGPSGLDYPLQASLWQNNTVLWAPTTATAGLRQGTAGAGAGTYSTALPTTTSTYTSMKRARWANVVTTTNQVLGQRNTEAMFFRGNASNQGGFFFFARCGFDVWTNGGRFFAGMHTGTTVISADPSALNNTVGFCVDAADAGAISFLTRGTVATKAATGLTITSGKGYDIYIFCAPNSAQYTWRIVDINTGTEASGTATANLPTNTTLQTAGVLASNAALTPVTSIQLGINRIYVETDY